jgi:hypothetical protein
MKMKWMLVLGKMRRQVPGLLMVAAALAISCSPATRASELRQNPSWAGDSLWDDGLAEVSTYDAVRMVYGKPRSHTAHIILVKEDFDEKTQVKADPPYEGRSLVNVLKMNFISTLQTDNYPYHYLASIFLDRDRNLSLVKATVGSQEWCGNTFKEIRVQGGRTMLHYHSYFDGQAGGEQALPAGALLTESLLVRLRSVVLDPGEEIRFDLLSPVVSNRAGSVPVRTAVLTAGSPSTVTVPAGTFPGIQYTVTLDGGEWLKYWVGVSGTRPLLKMQSSGGDELLLKDTGRRDYWSR